ncbi:hypothetical protein vseg_011766 [Gypsophila vaccaria]
MAKFHVGGKVVDEVDLLRKRRMPWRLDVWPVRMTLHSSYFQDDTSQVQQLPVTSLQIYASALSVTFSIVRVCIIVCACVGNYRQQFNSLAGI